MNALDGQTLELLRPMHFQLGWGLVLAGFLSGALLGLGFHRQGFAGGYASLRRRLTRLGHIACVALGVLLVLYAACPWPLPGSRAAAVGDAAWIVGALAMPLVCFLSAWRERFRYLFPVPVLALVTGVLCILSGGPS